MFCQKSNKLKMCCLFFGITIFLIGCQIEKDKYTEKQTQKKQLKDSISEPQKDDELFSVEATLSLPEAPNEDDITTIDTVFIENGVVNIYPLETEVFEDAQFEGGTKNFRKILQKELMYPQKLAKVDIEGMVFLQFVVTQKGKIENIKIIKDLGYGTGEANVKALEKVAQKYTWKPAKNAQGQPMKVKKVISIRFK